MATQGVWRKDGWTCCAQVLPACVAGVEHAAQLNGTMKPSDAFLSPRSAPPPPPRPHRRASTAAPPAARRRWRQPPRGALHSRGFEPEFEQAGAAPARSARCWASEASAPTAPTAGARSPTRTGSSRLLARAAGPTPVPLAGPVVREAPRAHWQHAACSGGLRSAGPARLNGSFEGARAHLQRSVVCGHWPRSAVIGSGLRSAGPDA